MQGGKGEGKEAEAPLIQKLGDDAGTHSASPLSNSEPHAVVHGHGLPKLNGQGGVVTRHHHLRARGQRQHRARDV